MCETKDSIKNTRWEKVFGMSSFLRNIEVNIEDYIASDKDLRDAINNDFWLSTLRSLTEDELAFCFSKIIKIKIISGIDRINEDFIKLISFLNSIDVKYDIPELGAELRRFNIHYSIGYLCDRDNYKWIEYLGMEKEISLLGAAGSKSLKYLKYIMENEDLDKKYSNIYPVLVCRAMIIDDRSDMLFYYFSKTKPIEKLVKAITFTALSWNKNKTLRYLVSTFGEEFHLREYIENKTGKVFDKW